MITVRFLKMMIRSDALHLHTGVIKNQHFKSTLLGGREGVSIKSRP